MSIGIRRLLLMAAILLAAAQGSWAQGLFGAISGAVVDESGGRLPGVTATATAVATGQSFTAVSTGEGVFTLSPLTPGTYELKVELEGFRTFVRQGLQVGANQTITVDVRMLVGAITEQVTVTAETPVLQSAEASKGQNFRASEIQAMPVGRDVTAMMTVLPGVVPNAGNFSNSIATGNINGSRATSSDVSVDGASIITTNLGGADYQPILEAVEEVVVRTSNFSADLGRGGAQVNITTKSGSNEFRGSVFYYHQNDALNANSFFNNARGLPKADVTQHQWGGVVGGPIVKNKTFFTFAYEGTKRPGKATITSTVPTARMRSGDFSELAAVIYDPATRTPFPGNVIPASQIDPISVRILEHYPAPNLPGLANNYAYQMPTDQKGLAFNSRLDHAFTQGQRLTARYGYREGEAPQQTIRFPGPAGAASQSSSETLLTTFQTLAVAHTWVVNSAMVNTFNVGYFLNRNQGEGPGTNEDWPSKLGFTNVPGDKYPFLSFAGQGYSPLGGSNFADAYPARNLEISNTFEWLFGRQSLKMGAEFRNLAFDVLRHTSLNLTFDNRPTNNGLSTQVGGNSFASFLLGIPSTTQVDLWNDEGFQFRNKHIAAYVQDDIRWSKNLTINAGLRWEVTTPRLELNDLQSVYSFDTNRVELANTDGYPRTLRDAKYTNFQPRLGFAYTFGEGHNVIRGGYGVFVLAADVLGDQYGNPGPANTNLTVQAPNNTTFPVTFRTGIPMPTLPARAPIPVTPNTNVLYMERDQKTPRQQQWNLTYQRQLTGNLSAEIGYVGNRGDNLEFNLQLNTLPPDRLGAGRDARPYPNVGNITVNRAGGIGYFRYHALQAQVNRRLSGGLGFNAAYTFSRTIDNASDVLAFRGASITNTQDYYDLEAERSLATYDVPHVLAWNVIWEVPMGKGRRFLDHGGLVDAVLGGWNLGFRGSALSGRPLAITAANNTTESFGGGLRPNRAKPSGALPDDQRTLQQWFDVTAYAQPAPRTYGNVSRTEPDLRGPGQFNLDALLNKEFSLLFGHKLQLRAEALNVLNHFNPGQPSTSFGSNAFGSITSEATPPRRIQLSFRYLF